MTEKYKCKDDKKKTSFKKDSGAKTTDLLLYNVKHSARPFPYSLLHIRLLFA